MWIRLLKKRKQIYFHQVPWKLPKNLNAEAIILILSEEWYYIGIPNLEHLYHNLKDFLAGMWSRLVPTRSGDEETAMLLQSLSGCGTCSAQGKGEIFYLCVHNLGKTPVWLENGFSTNICWINRIKKQISSWLKESYRHHLVKIKIYGLGVKTIRNI